MNSSTPESDGFWRTSSSKRSGWPASTFTNALVPKYASTTPSAPPAIESSSDSVNICRTSRRRPAPSETRKAISTITARAAGQKHAGDVGAGDQQQQADGRHQKQKRFSEAVAKLRQTGFGGREFGGPEPDGRIVVGFGFLFDRLDDRARPFRLEPEPGSRRVSGVRTSVSHFQLADAA